MHSLIILALSCLIIFIISIYLGLLFKGIDRKGAAYYQSRIGPPLRQPYWDLKKLMMKQTIIPENSVPWIFKGAPLLSFASSVVLLIYIILPYFMHLAGLNHSFIKSGDLILIVYLLMIPAIAMVAGGFASGSPYASVGAQREMVILMSTELPIAVIVVTFAWKMAKAAPEAASFNLATITSNPLWNGMGPLGIMGGIILVLVMIAVVPAELAKIPFDQGEAETEIAEGLLAEYSGKYFAFFYLSEAVKVLAITSLMVILFFPHGVAELFGARLILGGIDFTIAADVVLFLFKHIIIYFFTVTTIRIAMARLKITQVAQLFLLILTVTSLMGFLLIYLDPVISKI